jgi:alkylation response protein AidB-like acyl-CoA dehydrogenase
VRAEGDFDVQQDQKPKAYWAGLMHALGSGFTERADRCDSNDTFVAENFAELKERGVLAAGVPVELGGGGASYPELCEMLRILGRYCGSTALTLAMHTHPLATLVWRWRRDPTPVERILRRVADERLQLVTSGASDWLDGSGTAVRVEGGWRINARKRFASGSPVGDLLMTTAVDTASGPEPVVLHLALPLATSGVTVLDNWHTLGMRGTGSHDIVIKDAYVPETAVSMRRPPGRWVPQLQLMQIIALPLVLGCYLGVAEAMRDRAVAIAADRVDTPEAVDIVGEMETELAIVRIAHRDMVEAAFTLEPGADTLNRVFTGRTVVGRTVLRVAERAMEAAGGSAFYRAAGLERLFRDIQGVRYHRPQERMQLRYSGELALGREPNS